MKSHCERMRAQVGDNCGRGGIHWGRAVRSIVRPILCYRGEEHDEGDNSDCTCAEPHSLDYAAPTGSQPNRRITTRLTRAHNHLNFSCDAAGFAASRPPARRITWSWNNMFAPCHYARHWRHRRSFPCLVLKLSPPFLNTFSGSSLLTTPALGNDRSSLVADLSTLTFKADRRLLFSSVTSTIVGVSRSMSGDESVRYSGETLSCANAGWKPLGWIGFR